MDSPRTTDEIIEQAELFCILATNDPAFIADYRAAMEAVASIEHAGWKKRNGMTQEDKVLKHIQLTGSITQREAMIDYGIQSFTKRISNLRAAGHDIVRRSKRHPITGQPYSRYVLS